LTLGRNYRKIKRKEEAPAPQPTTLPRPSTQRQELPTLSRSMSTDSFADSLKNNQNSLRKMPKILERRSIGRRTSSAAKKPAPVFDVDRDSLFPDDLVLLKANQKDIPQRSQTKGRLDTPRSPYGNGRDNQSSQDDYFPPPPPRRRSTEPSISRNKGYVSSVIPDDIVRSVISNRRFESRRTSMTVDWLPFHSMQIMTN
jgi:hypothetical protein